MKSEIINKFSSNLCDQSHNLSTRVKSEWLQLNMCIACTPVNKYFAKELLFVFKLVENTVHLSSKILIQINLILKRKKKKEKKKKHQNSINV